MIEEVIVEEKQSVAVKWEERVKKTLKFKTSDGSVFDTKEKANSRQEYLDKRSKITKLELNDSLFGPDYGEFWYFKTFEEMSLIINHEYDEYVDNQRWKNDKIGNFVPGWYYLQHNDGGDSRDYTQVWYPDEIKESMKKTLEVFSYMSVIEQ